MGKNGPLGLIIVLFIEFDTAAFLTSSFLIYGFFCIKVFVSIFFIEPVYYGFLRLETVEIFEVTLLTDDLLSGIYVDTFFAGSFFTGWLFKGLGYGLGMFDDIRVFFTELGFIIFCNF